MALIHVAGEQPFAAPGKCDLPLVDPVCEIAKTIGDKAVDVVTSPFRYVANSAVDAITLWVADTAQWIVTKVISFIDTSTSPALDAAWFTERYRFMIGLAALVLLPMLLVATIRAVISQDMSQLLRSFFIHLPTAVIGTFVAVVLTQTLLTITDSLSTAVAEGVAGDVSEIFGSVGTALGGSAGTQAVGAPSFAIFFVALLLIVGAFFVWLELLIRSAAVTVSVFFFPMILAGLVWPATAHWTKRMTETLVALILSKFVIVAVISLATAALSDPGGGGFGSVMGGTALMMMAAFSPMVLLKLIPLAEGSAVAHLQGLSRRPLEAVRAGGSSHHAIDTMRSRMAGMRSQSLAGAAPATAVAGAAMPTTAAAAAAKGLAAKPAVPGSQPKKDATRGTEADVDTRPINPANKAAKRPSRPKD